MGHPHFIVRRDGSAEHFEDYADQLVGGCGDEDYGKHGERGGDGQGDERWLINGHDTHFSYDGEGASEVF